MAPTAEAATEHFASLCKRYQRAWCEPLIGPWKKEFQARGAPHFHLSATPPMSFTVITDPQTGQDIEADFRRWLSITWADIVAHPDPEQRRRHLSAGTRVDYAEGIELTDPRRMAVYFAKYGTVGDKEYQHQVPTEWITSYLVCEDCGLEGTDDRPASSTPVAEGCRAAATRSACGGAAAALGATRCTVSDAGTTGRSSDPRAEKGLGF